MPRFSRSSRTSVGLSWFVFLKSDRRIARPDRISRRGVRDCRFSARKLLDEVHRSHAAQVMRVSEEFSSWGLQTDLAAVAPHPAATSFARLEFAWSVLLAGIAIVVEPLPLHAVNGDFSVLESEQQCADQLSTYQRPQSRPNQVSSERPR